MKTIEAKEVLAITAKTKPGHYCFMLVPDAVRGGVRIGGFQFKCPCGCGETLVLPIRPHDKDEMSWDLLGSREKPTLNPMIDYRGHWHGSLVEGKWTKIDVPG